MTEESVNRRASVEERLASLEATVSEHEDYIENQVHHAMDEAEKAVEQRVGQLQDAWSGMFRSKVEIKTLVQVFEDEDWTKGFDRQLAEYLNGGWDILDLTVTSVLETADDVDGVWYHRIVTLRRVVAAENADYRTSVETE